MPIDFLRRPQPRSISGRDADPSWREAVLRLVDDPADIVFERR